LNLLLFLSALLTGFTGALSGERRTDAPAVQQSVARALEVVAEAVAVVPVRAPHVTATLLNPVLSERAARPYWAVQHAISGLDRVQVDEKRLV